jgi:hypothetical protein
VLAWPPSAGLPFVPQRWYGSMTCGQADTVLIFTGSNFTAGANDSGIWLVPFYQWSNSKVTFDAIGTEIWVAGGGADIRLALYGNGGLNSAGTFPLRLIAKSPTITLPGGNNQLVESPFTSPVSLDSGQVYWLAILANPVNPTIRFRGWVSGTGTDDQEGFTLTGYRDPTSISTPTKEPFLLLTQPTAAIYTDFPDDLQALPTGSLPRITFQGPRVVLRAM